MADGLLDCLRVGVPVGIADGWLDGLCVGAVVGMADGLLDGLRVDMTDGLLDGLRVGMADRQLDGLRFGVAIGPIISSPSSEKNARKRQRHQTGERRTGSTGLVAAPPLEL